MTEDNSDILVNRLFAGLSGFILGAIVGAVALVCIIIAAGSFFGRDNLLGAALVGATIGSTFGFSFPRLGGVFIMIVTSL